MQNFTLSHLRKEPCRNTFLISPTFYLQRTRYYGTKSVSWARVGRNFRESQLKCFKPAIVNPEYQNVDGLKTHGMLRPHCWTFRLSLIWALVTEKERREGQGL